MLKSLCAESDFQLVKIFDKSEKVSIIVCSRILFFDSENFVYISSLRWKIEHSSVFNQFSPHVVPIVNSDLSLLRSIVKHLKSGCDHIHYLLCI